MIKTSLKTLLYYQAIKSHPQIQNFHFLLAIINYQLFFLIQNLVILFLSLQLLNIINITNSAYFIVTLHLLFQD